MRRRHTIFFPVFIFTALIFSPSVHSLPANKPLLLTWWNCENLFDEFNDPLTDDDEFTPEGKRNWTEKNLKLKQMRIRHLLMAVKADPDYGKFPDLIALAEVENRRVFQQTLSGIPSTTYSTLYYESPDPRGIDIGLAYNPRTLTLRSSKAYTVHLDNNRPTRMIIVAGVSASGHHLDVILNHWPSRSLDTRWSEPKRMAAAKVTRHILDSLRLGNPGADIVTMGDFNDEPENRSIKEVLGSSFDADKVRREGKHLLYNCWSGYSGIGSYSYHGKWSRIDQILLSSGLLDKRGFSMRDNAFRCFVFSKMLDNSGKKTWPTYEKQIYKGGYSDHLPLLLKLHTNP